MSLIKRPLRPTATSILLGTTTTIALLAIGASALQKRHSSSFASDNNKFTTASIIMPAASIAATSPATTTTMTPGLSKEEEQNSKIWNRFADSYFKSKITDEESYKKKLEITREYMTPQSKVLEFGCGTGGTAILHAPYVESIHAIDLSSRMIEIAEQQKKQAIEESAIEEKSSKQLDNIKFECAGIDSMEVPDESYDMVLGLSILHLLPNKDEIIQKIYTKTKPSGYFVSSTICMGDFAKYIGWMTAPLSYFGIIPKLNVFTKSELRKSIEDAGFTIEREYHPANDKAVFLVARKNK